MKRADIGKPPLQNPTATPEPMTGPASPSEPAAPPSREFRTSEVPPGSAFLVGTAAVFNVAGRLCATQAKCTHRGGSLNEGTLDGSTVTCPLHGAQFNVCTGAVLRGPARDALETYPVIVEGDVGRVNAS